MKKKKEPEIMQTEVKFRFNKSMQLRERKTWMDLFSYLDDTRLNLSIEIFIEEVIQPDVTHGMDVVRWENHQRTTKYFPMSSNCKKDVVIFRAEVIEDGKSSTMQTLNLTNLRNLIKSYTGFDIEDDELDFTYWIDSYSESLLFRF